LGCRCGEPQPDTHGVIRGNKLLDARSILGEVRLSCFKVDSSMHVGTVPNLQNKFLVAVSNVIVL